MDLLPEGMSYISGPMTGIEDFNRPTFIEACRLLRDAGCKVWSPHECTPLDSVDLATDVEAWRAYMRADLTGLLRCENIVMLPGWPTSRGAACEMDLALRLGLNIYTLDPESGVMTKQSRP